MIFMEIHHNTLFKNSILFALMMAMSNLGWADTVKISPNVAGSTPGSYTFLTWPSSSQNRLSEDYTITVNSNPGPNSNVFWSNQFSIGSYGGYTGMQSTYMTNGSLVGKQFLFSVWGATASKVGSQGSSCI